MPIKAAVQRGGACRAAPGSAGLQCGSLFCGRYGRRVDEWSCAGLQMVPVQRGRVCSDSERLTVGWERAGSNRPSTRSASLCPRETGRALRRRLRGRDHAGGSGSTTFPRTRGNRGMGWEIAAFCARPYVVILFGRRGATLALLTHVVNWRPDGGTRGGAARSAGGAGSGRERAGLGAVPRPRRSQG
jgi:hypothetical protein